MKKRLLALALCLLMVASLLPVTAFALADKDIVGIEDQGVYCVGTYFTVNQSVASSVISVQDELKGVVIDPDGNGRYKLPGDSGNPLIQFTYFDEFGVPNTMSFSIYLRDHVWQFTQKENSLTATCQNQLDSQCPIGKASLTLDAHSVTLPGSPFNAQVILNGITEEQIKEEFGYLISPIRYKFKAPGDSAFTEITPADGAREGTYQAAVTLSPIEVAARYARNDDGTTQGLVTEPDGSITLYTQYTAVNPETTAQTGDNRPIELMMGSVVAFSALAAAAFILDSKRRSQQ